MVRRVITAFQVVIAVAVVVAVCWLVAKQWGYLQAQQVYRDIESAYAVTAAPNAEGAADAADAADAPPVDFAALRHDYPNVVAWLAMDDMDISYPIVQGDDNEYYLHYDAADQASVSGAIYLDYRNKSLDTDLYALIYGHNMRDESMFGQLDEYVSADFYRNHSGTFRLYTADGSYRYRIFAADIVNPTDEIYTAGFTNTQVFAAFARQIQERSMYDTGVEVAGSDHVVTLSTCSSTNRLVLSAKRI